MKIQPPVNTPYQQLKHSKVGKIVRENKVLTGVAATAGTVVMAGASVQSEAFAKVAQYGIAPAAGLGLAAVSALAAHDAVVNDLPERPFKGTAKLAAGAAGTLGGLEIVGHSLNIPVLDQAFSTPLRKLAENGQGLLGVAVAGGGVAAGKFAVQRFQAAAQGESRARNLSLGLASGVTSAAATLGGVELIGRNFQIPVVDQALTGTVKALAAGGVGSVAAGALLVGGAVQLAGEAAHNFKKGGNDFVTLAEGMGAVTAGLGGLQLAGHGLGLKATEGLLTEHGPLMLATALTGTGASALKSSAQNIQKSGVRPLNSLGLTAAAGLIPGGLAVAADAVGMQAASRFLGDATLTGLGLGMGVTSYAMGRSAVDSARRGDLMNAAGQGLASATLGAGGLFTVGAGAHIPGLETAGRKVLQSTIEPFLDHVVVPSARFLFNNPLAGGACLALGVGGYLAARYSTW
ncbi:MAG: hypothetical protein KF760_34235 [Candidatus Eremiobacteraeota bacterium]|nr:hypothetical protein [Candidatus Eremiobacteraeota bacterium]MCW5872815.1 hypothetical protein [Candidatus Eremiobacteraeota bacterium]